VVRLNGLVDTSQSISDASLLAVRPADDALQLTSLEVGNFEWWYFDVIDAHNGYVLKFVAHLGTDPLRTHCYPTVAVVASTPHAKKTVRQAFVVKDLRAAREYCDVKINDALHIWIAPDGDVQTYHLTVRLPGFSATLRFRGLMAGWKPLGDAMERACMNRCICAAHAGGDGVCSDCEEYTSSASLGRPGFSHRKGEVRPGAG
jgi:hypothetical protein